ncbi:hypothetical protein DSO57_1010157 [Entomophthora muscae]|uniref:Uncharacterized protein n=1 Tax=Entomophthora muscae TaxID=34485 RepID=A0ACC2UHE8_9FUNG|nr:hypothetical protein DSO57_1010157 [Entomophthora muscae]
MSKTVNMTNLSIMVLLCIETLLRGATQKGGLVSFFSDKWNLLDWLMIVTSGACEAVDLILVLDLSRAVPVIATVRLISSLRNVIRLHRSSIAVETSFEERLRAEIIRLEYELDLKLSDNGRLDDELNAKRRKIARTTDDRKKIDFKMLKAQRVSWESLVPSVYSFNSKSKSRKQSPSVRSMQL